MMRVDTKTAPAHGRGLYCGPYALMVLCGLRKPESALQSLRRVSSRLRGKRRIAGVALYELLDALADRGVAPVESQFFLPGDAPTLAQWYKQRGVKQGTYLVIAGNHYLVICGTRITCCQSTRWQPFHERKSYKRARVTAALWLGRNQSSTAGKER